LPSGLTSQPDPRRVSAAKCGTLIHVSHNQAAASPTRKLTADALAAAPPANTAGKGDSRAAIRAALAAPTSAAAKAALTKAGLDDTATATVLGALTIVGAGATTMTTRQSAAVTGLTPAAFRSTASRLRSAGTDLRAPRTTWPDERTVLYDPVIVLDWYINRPGRGYRSDLKNTPRSGALRGQEKSS